MEKKTSEAQLRASRAWAERNKEKRKIISLRGSARSFIRNWAQIEDLEELLRVFPQYELWLLKGDVDPARGQVAPGYEEADAKLATPSAG